MGGSKSVVVGYKYSLGAHLALCHGPVDVIREIQVDKRLAWSVTTGAAAEGESNPPPPTRYPITEVEAEPASGGQSTISFRMMVQHQPSFQLGSTYSIVSGGTRRRVTLVSARTQHLLFFIDYVFTVAEPGLSFTAAEAEIFLDTTSGIPANAGGRGGPIRINRENLFGGESREGGIKGDVDVMMGAPDQGANDYLAAQLGAAVPAYRGICSLVLRQVYMGLNPYLKAWAVKLTRILQAEGGAEQWYPQRAQIVSRADISDCAIYFALDVSGSMSGSRMNAQKAAVAALVREISEGVDPDLPNDIRVVTWSAGEDSAFERRNMAEADYEEVASWVEALPPAAGSGTNFAAAFASAESFFTGAMNKRRIVIFLTDGEPTPPESVYEAVDLIAAMPSADIFTFNIALSDTSYTELLDNTPLDGVPVVPPGDSDALVNSIRAAFGAGPDMNAAHIIRECLTNSEWGLGLSSLEIGTSFTAAADRLYLEGFGLSFLWQQDGSVEDFINGVLDHIDASLYIDRRTGLWEIKLIRADDDLDSLLILDEASVIDWGRLGRRLPADLVNSVTVRYTDGRTDEQAALTVTDTARVLQMGEVIPAVRDYPGIRNERLAVRAAERELAAFSAPILSGEIVANRKAADLYPGMRVKLRSPKRELHDVVMRVFEVGQGDGQSNGIRLQLGEDVFAIGSGSLAGGRQPPPRPLTRPPSPLTRRMVEEAPYWLMVKEAGHAAADQTLADDPDGGTIVAIGERPSPDARGAQIWLDAGADPVEDGVTGYAPTAILDQDVSEDPEQTTFAVRSWTEIEDVALGTLAWLGGELVRVDGIGLESITVGRGCLDRLPRAHSTGTPIVFFDAFASLRETVFTAGELVDVRLLPETGRGTLAYANAPVDEVTFARRGIRPLPPGNLRANDAFVGVLWDGEPITLTWSHRDRTTQTSPVIDHYLTGNIGPEPGTTYNLRAFALDDAGAVIELVHEELGLSVTSRTLGPEDLDAPVPEEAGGLRWEVESARDGYLSFEAARVITSVPPPPPPPDLGLLLIGSADELDEKSAVLIGDGGRVLVEEPTPAVVYSGSVWVDRWNGKTSVNAASVWLELEV